MQESLAKILSFVAFIVLGYILRRTGVLKAETFHAVSGLVIYVTLPCVIAANLNGIRIEGTMLLIALFGFAANILLLTYAWILTLRTKDRDMRDFIRLNLGGFSVGPFAVPYVSAFYPSHGVLATCVFDVGNVIMSGGGTYALISGSRVQTTFRAAVKLIASKLVRSGPLVAFAVMVVLSLFSLELPQGVVEIAKIGAAANAFLCMIMIGESIDLSMTLKKFLIVARIVALRIIPCIALAWFAYHYIPADDEVRKALVLTCLAPMPAMSLIYTASLGLDLAMAANLSSVCVAVSIASMSVALMIM